LVLNYPNWVVLVEKKMENSENLKENVNKKKIAKNLRSKI
jgi:hypothetical protein